MATDSDNLTKEDRMKSLMLLWKELADELGQRCCTSTTRDYKTVTRRFEHEGLSFLTITLPDFGKSLERALDEGQVTHDMFAGFSRHGGLPRFMGGFLERVFDRATGVLLDVPDVDSIFALRQLTLMFGKISVDCSDARRQRAIDKYIECEQEVRDVDSTLPDSSLRELGDMAHLLYGNLFDEVDRKVDNGELIPRHGPGKTADRLEGNLKFDQSVWPNRLDAVFPYGEYAVPNPRYNYLQSYALFLEPGAEIPARVVTVPKTLKTPRIIALEPTAMQYMQQALMQPFVECLERRTTNSLYYRDKTNVVYGMIGFTDQEPNQFLARKGSLHGDLATLDLSEASDRVSNQHVLEMMRRFPRLSEAVQATRSRKADVEGEVIDLAKFASMGSALCFPMEAMTFLSVIFLGIQDSLNRRLTRRDITSFRGCVRVYGDDIVVPVDHVRSVIRRLELYGYKVNSHKSFWTGKFRESCGKEYYGGEDVSVSRVRRLFPSSQIGVSEWNERVISLVGLRNNLYTRGLWQTAKWLDEKVIPRFLRYYPTVSPTSPVQGRWSYLGYDTQRTHPHTQAPLVKGFVVTPKPPASQASGEGSLLKCLLKQGSDPFADSKHLERQGRPDSVDIKIRWSSPF
jgi:hypothetical protein